MLETGEDVVTFFSKYGTSSDCPIKFVHLNRAPSGDRFRPYDLVVVPQKDIGPEYFTMSASGVVHMRPDGPSEFIAVADWMREATQFNVISSMYVPTAGGCGRRARTLCPTFVQCLVAAADVWRGVSGWGVRRSRFFKNYLVGKCLRAWRSNVRYNMYCRQRKQLSKTLFLAKPAFCSQLIDIYKQASTLEVRHCLGWLSLLCVCVPCTRARLRAHLTQLVCAQSAWSRE